MNCNMDIEKFISGKEAGEIIGVTTSRVSQLCEERKLISHKIGRRRVILKMSAEKYRDNAALRKAGPK